MIIFTAKGARNGGTGGGSLLWSWRQDHVGRNEISRSQTIASLIISTFEAPSYSESRGFETWQSIMGVKEGLVQELMGGRRARVGTHNLAYDGGRKRRSR